MISDKNVYSNYIMGEEGNFSVIDLMGRPKGKSRINFKTEEEVLGLFKRFSKKSLGHYTSVIRQDE